MGSLQRFMYYLVERFLSQSQMCTFHFALYATFSIGFWNGLPWAQRGLASVAAAGTALLHWQPVAGCSQAGLPLSGWPATAVSAAAHNKI